MSLVFSTQYHSKASHPTHSHKEEEEDGSSAEMENKERVEQRLEQIPAEEDIKRIDQCNEQEENKEDQKPDKEKCSQENKDFNMVGASLIQEFAEHVTTAETSSEEKPLEDERTEKIGKDSLKKPKQAPKQIPKAKLTVPQPFSFTTEKRARERHNSVDFTNKVTVPQPSSFPTEKRMLRERRNSVDFSNTKPTLSKSTSLNYRANGQTSLRSEANTELRCKTSTRTPTRTNSKPKLPTTDPVDKRTRIQNDSKTKELVQTKEVGPSKTSQAKAKENSGEEIGKNKLRPCNSFKASPLRSFYHRKEQPLKPETKKVPLTQPKSPLLGQRTKPANKTESSPKEKEKRVTRTITSTAKRTISKLLGSSRKSIGPPKEAPKIAISAA